MIDGWASLEPQLVEGPRVPTDTLRPLPSEERLLLVASGEALMVDLQTGDIRRWENGPPVSVPCVSDEFDVTMYEHMQFQVLRDPRPSSVDLVLLSLQLGANEVSVVESTGGRLQIRRGADVLASRPIGGSPAVVTVVEPVASENGARVTVSTRNAETTQSIAAQVDVVDTSAIITVGGSSTAVTGRRGRRRLMPVHITATRHPAPVDQLRQTMRRLRQLGRRIRSRSAP